MPISAIILVLISTFLHAGWNLLLRSQRTNYTLLHISLLIVAVGLGPALIAEFLGPHFPAQVWFYLVLAGIFQAYYNLGLTKGYQSGDFTVVYPVARALPILLVAVTDGIRGYLPSPMAWLGMVLVSVGCVVTPLRSLNDFKLTYYWNRTMIWIVLTALATVGYTTVDNAAAELISPGPLTASRYGIFEISFTVPIYWLILIGLRQPTVGLNGWQSWKWPVVGAVGVFGAYWLVLWSYQLSHRASYVVALRQFSIVIGVVIGTFLFHEQAPILRISASVMIAIGIACIGLFG